MMARSVAAATGISIWPRIIVLASVVGVVLGCAGAAGQGSAGTTQVSQKEAERRKPPASDFAFEPPPRLSEPYEVVCSIAYRASAGAGEKQEELLRLGPQDERSVSLGSHTLKANFFSDPFEGSSVNLRVDSMAWLFQFKQEHPPLNQFLGGHGFTGLIYVSDPQLEDDLQFFCALSASAR